MSAQPTNVPFNRRRSWRWQFESETTSDFGGGTIGTCTPPGPSTHSAVDRDTRGHSRGWPRVVPRPNRNQARNPFHKFLIEHVRWNVSDRARCPVPAEFLRHGKQHTSSLVDATERRR